MVNEDKIKELEKKIVSPNYSESLPGKNNRKTNMTELKRLAKQIRKTVEDYNETTSYQHTPGKP